MNYKTLSAIKRKFIELINKKPINNLEINALTNELVGEHRIDFMIKDKVNVLLKFPPQSDPFTRLWRGTWRKIFSLRSLWLKKK